MRKVLSNETKGQGRYGSLHLQSTPPSSPTTTTNRGSDFSSKETTKYQPFGLIFNVTNEISTFFIFLSANAKWGTRISAIVMQQLFETSGKSTPLLGHEWGNARTFTSYSLYFGPPVTGDYTRSDCPRILFPGNKWGVIPWSAVFLFAPHGKFA